MARLSIHWRLAEEPPQDTPVAHFFLYREGEEVHSDHRLYTREELERRVDGILAGSGVVPAYYREALAAIDDPRAPRDGRCDLD